MFMGLNMARKKPKNYISPDDIAAEIHKSKMSYCHCIDDKYSMFDIIVDDIEKLSDDEVISTAISNRAKRLEISEADIKKEDLVFRVMTWDHIPVDFERKHTHNTEADWHVKLNFKPFEHYILKNDKPVLVCRSHWKGDFTSGQFCDTHGQLTDELCKMFRTLTERMATKPFYNGYSYLDEMISDAVLMLVRNALKYDESKGFSPFSYLSRIISNEFTARWNIEKNHQRIRDKIMMDNGLNPSNTAQIDEDWDN